MLSCHGKTIPKPSAEIIATTITIAIKWKLKTAKIEYIPHKKIIIIEAKRAQEKIATKRSIT